MYYLRWISETDVGQMHIGWSALEYLCSKDTARDVTPAQKQLVAKWLKLALTHQVTFKDVKEEFKGKVAVHITGK